MRVLTKNILSIGTAMIAGSAILSLSTGALAWDHWDRDHDRYRHWEHERWEHARPVYVHERPVVVERERPVFVAPPVVYAPPAPSGLNLNFNIPLN